MLVDKLLISLQKSLILKFINLYTVNNISKKIYVPWCGFYEIWISILYLEQTIKTIGNV